MDRVLLHDDMSLCRVQCLDTTLVMMLIFFIIIVIILLLLLLTRALELNHNNIFAVFIWTLL